MVLNEKMADKDRVSFFVRSDKASLQHRVRPVIDKIPDAIDVDSGRTNLSNYLDLVPCAFLPESLKLGISDIASRYPLWVRFEIANQLHRCNWFSSHLVYCRVLDVRPPAR